METFERLESEVRGYCRSWPTVFAQGEGCHLIGEDGQRYLDFFAGAGALNYGHNHPVLMERLVEHIQGGGIIHGLDMATTTKRDFLLRFEDDRPQAPRPRVQGPVPRPDRHQRRRVRAQAGPQGHRPRAHRRLHQRLPRHDARVPRRDRQQHEAQGRRRPPPHGRQHAVRGLPRRRHRHPRLLRGHAGRRRQRHGHARRGDRRDHPGRGRHQRGHRRVAAGPPGPVPAPRHPPHHRRHPGRLRPHRPVLQLGGDGPRPRHHLPVQVAVGLRAAVRPGADEARARRLGAGRAQRHLPRQQRRLRHRHRRPRDLLDRRHPPDRDAPQGREGPLGPEAASPPSTPAWSTTSAAAA